MEKNHPWYMSTKQDLAVTPKNSQTQTLPDFSSKVKMPGHTQRLKQESCSFFINFYLYIYPPNSQESAKGAIHRASNYPDLLSEMPKYCCLLEIVIEI